MQHAQLTLTVRNGSYYFEDSALVATHHGKGANVAQRKIFVDRHGLRRSHSKKHPSWAALLTPELRRIMHVDGNDYHPIGDFAYMDRLHDHAELFVKDGAYVYTTQPYDVRLHEYQVIEKRWRTNGLFVDISYVDAWWYPGRTPLIVISQVEIGLTK